jgi:hypothetical protein
VNEKVASFESARVAPDAPSAQRPQPSAADASASAQKAVLYVKDPDNPVGKTFVGTAFWRIHAESTARPASRIFIMLDVEIPDRGLVLAMSLRRDIEQGSAMSHLIELRFTRPNGSPLDTVSNVLGIRMKKSETAAGMQLTGSVVKVAPGIFLLGLSGAHDDTQQNVLLLKERNWLDIPIAYDNGSRSLLVVEKGAAGERAINEALATWGQ